MDFWGAVTWQLAVLVAHYIIYIRYLVINVGIQFYLIIQMENFSLRSSQKMFNTSIYYVSIDLVLIITTNVSLYY